MKSETTVLGCLADHANAISQPTVFRRHFLAGRRGSASRSIYQPAVERILSKLCVENRTAAVPSLLRHWPPQKNERSGAMMWLLFVIVIEAPSILPRLRDRSGKLREVEESD